jgi:hypothetical protein
VLGTWVNAQRSKFKEQSTKLREPVARSGV